MEGLSEERIPLIPEIRSEPVNSPVQVTCKRFGGIVLATLAAIIFAFSNLILKTLHNYHPFTVAVWRFYSLLIPSGTLVSIYACFPSTTFGIGPGLRTWPEIGKILFLILVRSFSGCTSVVSKMYALHFLNLSDASVIIYSHPVVVALLAHCILGEKTTWHSILYAIITFVGVTVISRPPMLTGQTIMNTKTVEGVIFAVLSMVLGALAIVSLRLMRFIHFSMAILLYGICSAIECTILAAIEGAIDLPHGHYDWSLAICFLAFLGQACHTIAINLEKAGQVSLILSTDVVFSFILQFIFLGVIPDKYSIIGSAIVIIGVSLATFCKKQTSAIDNSPAILGEDGMSREKK